MDAKLPIPRLRGERRQTTRGRTSRACGTCRERKHKCDGAKPTCSQCVAQGFGSCFYPERKTVQLQRAVVAMRKEIQAYRELLEHISEDIRGPFADRVARALKRYNQDETMNRDIEISSPSSTSVAFFERKDVMNEDFDRSEESKMTGFVGNAIETAWMQCLGSQASKYGPEATLCLKTGLGPLDGSSMVPLNHHLNHRSISNTIEVNPFALPSKVLADSLFQLYLDRIHESLPIIRKDLFVAQYRQCFLRKGNLPGRKWLAVLNMVLAIACASSRHSGLEMSQEADENVFSARARALSISENVLYDHDDLQQVQAEALMAFFFLMQSQINKSWKMIGIATRSGIALGLNLRKKTMGLDVKSREARNQLWWSIFRLESLLSIMTGRVSSLGDASSFANPPFLNPKKIPGAEQPINELQWTINMDKRKAISQTSFLQSLQPTHLLYRFYMVDLALITHTISNEVFSFKQFCIGWSCLESRVAFYHEKLNFWASTIHASFGFHGAQPVSTARGFPYQCSLALNYYSAHILLNRPFLDGPASDKKHDSRESGIQFANKMAFNCLQASLNAIAIFPEQPDLAWCYQGPHWWNILHVLKQSIAILLLYISEGPTSASTEDIQSPSELVVWAGMTKGLRWLHCLGKTSESARRDFHLLNICVQRMMPYKNVKSKDISLVIDPSRTPDDPKQSGLKDIPEESSTSFSEENAAIGYEQHSKRSFSINGDEDPVCFQDLLGAQRPSVPGALAVFGTDEKLLDLVSKSDSAIVDILLSLMDCNS